MNTELGQLLMVLLGDISLGVWIGMTSRDWRISSHKGQRRFHDLNLPHTSIMTLGYYYDFPGMNEGEQSYGLASAT
jgi:hypothetical protein